MKKEFLPGWALMAVLAVGSMWVSGLVEVGKKHPLEAAMIAIIVGILLRNLKLLPKVFDAGVKAFQTPLIWGIVLYGSKLKLDEVKDQGGAIIGTVIITMAVGFFAIYFLARAFKLPQGLSTLLAVGTTICGGSAIAITSPLIKAKEEETSYAITTIALWGLVAILAYPKIGQLIGVSDQAFGVFAGTAIHSTPQVVGAATIFSDQAGALASGVKLVRNCFMIPLALIIAVIYTSTHATKGQEKSAKLNWMKAFPWFLFGFFVMAILRTPGVFGEEGLFSETGLKLFGKWGSFFILMGMAGIGMNTRFDSFKGIGIKPFVVGLIGSVIVAAVSILLICLLGLSGPA